MEDRINKDIVCRTCLSENASNLEDMYETKIVDMLNACYSLQVYCFLATLKHFFKISNYRFLT